MTLSNAKLSLEGDDNLLVLFGGFKVELEWAKQWGQELVNTQELRSYFSQLWAFKGPDEVQYRNFEFDFEPLMNHLRDDFSGTLYLVAHSSGSFPCHNLLTRIINDDELHDKLMNQVVYINLDGAIGKDVNTFTSRMAHFLKFGLAVSAEDEQNQQASFNQPQMVLFAGQYPNVFEHLVLNPGATGFSRASLHDAVINSCPHDKDNYDLKADYCNYDLAHPVNREWLNYAVFNKRQ